MIIPGYELLAKCGRGGSGDVWIVQDLAGRRSALKLIDLYSGADKEFAGLRSYARLQDFTHLIRIFHIGETPDYLYYTMELADSLDCENYYPATLRNILNLRRRMPANEVLLLTGQLLAGLQELHRANLVHRDIKLENILFVDGKIKLSDVGLLRSLSGTLSIGGTLGFIPPERLKRSAGSQTQADDLYALGKVMYCMWSGNEPGAFPAIPAEVLREKDAPLLNSIITTACNRNPSARFQSAEEFSEALQKGVPWQKKLKKFIFPAIAAAVVLGVLLIWGIIAMIPAIKDSADKMAVAGNKILEETAKEIPLKPIKKALDALDKTPERAYAKTQTTTGAKNPAGNSGEVQGILEFSVSDGTEENTIVREFPIENQQKVREEQLLISVANFPSNKMWKSSEFYNSQREYDRLIFYDYASGNLQLLRDLPTNYRISCDVEMIKLDGGVYFTITSLNRHEVIRYGVKDGKISFPEKIVNGRKAEWSMKKSAVNFPQTKSHMEFIRTNQGTVLKLNGQIVCQTGYTFPGGIFSIKAECGMPVTLNFSNFRLYAL